MQYRFGVCMTVRVTTITGMMPQAIWCVAVGLSLLVGGRLAAQDKPVVFLEDPAKIVTAERCGECHVSSFAVWKDTPHATGFKNLHRQRAAEDISKKMGYDLIKRESLCLNCHYTPTIKRDQLIAVSGVSCESCHGAAADWIDIHNDYGKGFTYKTETPEHRRERIEKSRAAGMRRPSDLFEVAARCFQCHTVPEEELVNKGGHGTGSANFELVAWTQGEIRHNFLQSFLTGDGTQNAERDMPRKRLMYVLGRALDLSYSLRGMAVAKEARARYERAMSRRVRSALNEIREIDGRVTLAETREMISAVREVSVALGNRDALMKAAAKIDTSARKFLAGHDGKGLAGIDPLILGTAEPLPEEPEEEVADGGDSTITPGEPKTTTGSPKTSPNSGTSGGKTTTTSSPGRAAFGDIKEHIRAQSKHDTIGPKCGNCHGDQDTWWFGDKHFASADPFINSNPKNAKIAALYGLKTTGMARGDRVCMDCHGTVVTGRETREVRDGVSCESCHGAAADYLEPHKEGEKAMGVNRPGYIEGLKLGMVMLRDPATRANACTSCHYITDQRLISSGHPSGKNFDYAKGMQTIKHWQITDDPAALSAAFKAALSKRGAVPDVPLAALPDSGGGTDTATNAAAAQATERPTRPISIPRARPAASAEFVAADPGDSSQETAAITPVSIDLPAPPKPAGTVEERILQLKRRLDFLYQTLYPRQEGK